MRNKYIVVIFFFLNIFIHCFAEDVITMFEDSSNVAAGVQDEYARLYQVRLTQELTFVTIELTPKSNNKRLNFWTSNQTYVESGLAKLPLLGALDSDNSLIECTYEHKWGWNDVKKGQHYYYTLVFSGRIPEGFTNFSLIDPSSSGRGFGFRNYTINNPTSGEERLNENKCKDIIDIYDDEICGIYEEIGGDKNRIACIKIEDKYYLVYLNCGKHLTWWFAGDCKAWLEESSTFGIFKAIWVMLDKRYNNEAYVAFDGSSMKAYLPNASPTESTFMKMYPNATSRSRQKEYQRADGDASGSHISGSGTGFVIDKRGYLVTNYHVTSGASDILVCLQKDGIWSAYTASVVKNDVTNDISIIKIVDSNFVPFNTLPYRLSFDSEDIASEIFTLGYPQVHVMGTDIKYTTGVINSRTGVQGDPTHYQISAHIDHGNSGGPLFNTKGDIIGITDSGLDKATYGDVNYAIKSMYIKALSDALSLNLQLPNDNSISLKSRSEQIKVLSQYVALILVAQ